MAFDVIRNARLNDTEPVIKDGKVTYGRWKKPAFLLKEHFDFEIEYTVDNTKAGRPDLIAEEVYGTSDLYWVVIAAHRPLNPIGWPPTGTKLILPGSSEVYNDL